LKAGLFLIVFGEDQDEVAGERFGGRDGDFDLLGGGDSR
jgi:hypothetical protein